MKVGLFFGSFNPIHHGHLIIASHILNNYELEQIWFVVSPQNPLKPSAGLLNEYDRLHLVKLAIDGETRMRASDIEFRLPKPSYTIDTLTYLAEKYPEHDFAVIMGGDSFLNLPRWKNHEQLLRNYKVYVYERPGLETPVYPNTKQVVHCKAPLLEISATHIRNTIRSGHSIRYLVPDSVWQEIDRTGYYKH